MSEPQETRPRRPRVYPKQDADSIPVLQHWVSLPDAADELGLRRQRVHQMAGEGVFKTLHKISKTGRPIAVIKRSELEKIKAGKSTDDESTVDDETGVTDTA